MMVKNALRGMAKIVAPAALAVRALLPLATAQGQTPPKYSVTNLGTAFVMHGRG